MKTLAAVAFAAVLAWRGDRIDEIKWLTSKDAFDKAKDEKTKRWVLVYKEWPK